MRYLIVVVLGLLCACAEDPAGSTYDESVLGRWEGEGVFLVFAPGGVFSSDASSGSWCMEDGNLKICTPDCVEYGYRIIPADTNGFIVEELLVLCLMDSCQEYTRK